MPRQIVNIQDKLLEDNFENSKDKRKMVNKLCELERKYSNAFSMRMQTRKRLDNWIKIYREKGKRVH